MTMDRKMAARARGPDVPLAIGPRRPKDLGLGIGSKGNVLMLLD